MTPKEAQKKIYIASQVCYWASALFGTIAEQQEKSNKHILKEDFVEGLWDMSLREIAVLLDTANPNGSGGAIPKDCQEILK